MANTITFSKGFVNAGTGLGLECSTVEVAIYNSLNEQIETLVFPTQITESEPSSGDFLYTVTNYDVEDQTKFPGDHVSVLWNATSVSPAFDFEDVGENIAIVPGFVAATYDSVNEAPYADQAFANTHFNLTMDNDIWDSFTEDEQERALFVASNQMDTLNYYGEKFINAVEIRREWPRMLPASIFAFTSMEEVVIPADVRKACVVQALYLLNNKRSRTDPRKRADLQDQGVSGVSRLGSSESYDLNRRRRHPLCREAMDLVQKYIVRGGSIGSMGAMPW